MENTFLICLPGKGGGSAGGQGSDGIQTLIKGPILKNQNRVPPKNSIIQDHFFNHGVWNNVGKVLHY